MVWAVGKMIQAMGKIIQPVGKMILSEREIILDPHALAAFEKLPVTSLAFVFAVLDNNAAAR